MKLTITERFILADTVQDVIRDSQKSGVNRPELAEILTKISPPILFTVWTTECDRLDRNYLVCAEDKIDALRIIQREGEGKIQTASLVDAEFMVDFDFNEKDIPTEAGSWYMYDEGT